MRLSLRTLMLTTIVVALFVAANTGETYQVLLVSYASPPLEEECRSTVYTTAGFPNTWRERHHRTHTKDSACEENMRTEINWSGVVWNTVLGTLLASAFALLAEVGPIVISKYYRRRKEMNDLDRLLRD